MTIISYFPEFNGTVMTTHDCYCLLKPHIPKLRYLFVLPDKRKFIPFINYFPHISPFVADHNSNYSDDVIICSAYLFHSIAIGKLGLSISCDKLVVFDSACFIHDEYEHNGTVELIKNFDYLVLGNDFNKKYFEEDRYMLFPAPINFLRLDTFKIKRQSIYHVNARQRHRNLEPLSYKGFSYNRHESISGIFFENVGRTFFEYIYMNRDVFYSAKNKTLDDGLTYYMKLLGFDDTKDHVIKNCTDSVRNVFSFDPHVFLKL